MTERRLTRAQREAMENAAYEQKRQIADLLATEDGFVVTDQDRRAEVMAEEVDLDAEWEALTDAQ